MEDIKKIDVYELLEIESTASVQDIKKAYRKKALKCHPDKNPDNPKAADQFRQLSKILEVLCDENARTVYDRILKSRKEAKERIKNLDSNRRRYRDDLEAREKAAREEQEIKKQDEENLAKELERLRREGSKVVEEELNLIRSQLEKEILQMKLKENEIKLPRLKCKWSKRNEYDEMYLRNKFEECGKISCLVISKKGTSAIVEFEKTESAIKAYDNLKTDNFQIEWLQGNPKDNTFNDQYFQNFDNLSNKKRTSKKIYFDEEYEKKVLDKLNDAYLKQINK